MARRRRGHEEHEMSPLLNEDEAGYKEKLRLMVLGDDDALLDEACDTILGERQNRDAFHFGILEPRKGQVCGRQVSVLKTPSYWLKHLKSFRVLIREGKAIRNDMEFFESQLFPGPHAFLLVHRDVKNSGRENYLLRALSEVFGKEVLDYCMVLFIDEAIHNDPEQNSCVKMCGGRYHILHKTDDSVNHLFKNIQEMTKSKVSSFFTAHLECFRKASNYFQEEYEEKENNLRKELNDSRERESQLSKELNDSKETENQLSKELNESKEKENQLSKELNESKEKENQLSKELNDSKEKENQLSKELNDSKEKENQLSKELNDSKEKENRLSKELNDSKEKEKQLSKKLNDSKDKLNQMNEKFCTSSQSEKQLNEELIIYKDKERQLNEELNDLKDRENQLSKELNDSKDKLNQMSEKFCTSIHHEKQLNEELIIYKDRERQLKDDKEKLQRKVEQLEKEKQELKSRNDSQTSGSPGI